MVDKKEIPLGQVRVVAFEDPKPGQHTHMFHCPGCGYGHGFSVPPHSYNNDPVRPTVRNSLLVGGCGGALYRCHSYITDGNIQFLDDCTHNSKGLTLELPFID